MRCGSCGADNADDNRFCDECGTRLASACPTCGAPVVAGKRFCGQCGAALVPAASPERSTTEGTVQPEESARVATPELRRVSVVFVDLVNYTAWSEARDAEDVRELLSGYFEVARTVIRRYGGTVEKFIGDAVMAVWGAPTAQGDDPERAVRAGLEMVSAVAEFGVRRGLVDLQARAGVVTGQVATWDSPGEGLVTGDRVNTAARVQSAAEPGSVLVDEETRAASQAAVAYTPAGDHQVKGKAEPLSLWRALRVVGGVGGAQRVDGLEAGFIGRARELALVKELFHALEESGRARLVSVSGAAGVGKSRLGWEFEKYVDGLVSTVWWHRGRCLSYGDGVAFWALAEVVRQRFDIAEEDSTQVAAAKLDARLSDWVSDPAERSFVRPRLGVLIGAGDGVELPREELFGGWRLFFERLAETGPVVLVVEDLQWADSGLLDFLDYLLDWSADSSIFVLTFAWPELAERRPGWLADRRNASTVHLDPLPPLAMDELLDALVPGMPDRAKAQIAERAAGVPLFAVETIRSLVDRDVVVPDEGVYRLVSDVGELEVPGSLTSLLGARLDGLPRDERQLVKGLAVLGGTFPRAAVAAVTDASSEQVDDWLRGLVRKEILSVRSDPLSPERGQYEFTQAMLRSVAHDTLTKRERKSRHLAVAAHLRASFPGDGEDVAEVVAAHYHDAYNAARDDPDAEQVRQQAVEAYERAGRRAASVGAPGAAERAYRAAMTLATAEQDVTRFTEEAAAMASRAGRHEEALALYLSAAAEHSGTGRVGEAARLAAPIANCLSDLGRWQEGLPFLRNALAALESTTSEAVLAEVHTSLGRTMLFGGGVSPGVEHHVERALVLASAYEIPDVLSRALETKGICFVLGGRVVEAVAMAAAAADVARRHGLALRESTARHNLGEAKWQYDQPGARKEVGTAVELATRLGDRPGQMLGLYNLSLIAFFLGEWDTATDSAEDALAAAADDPMGYAFVSVLPVMLHTARGHDVQVAEHLPALAILDSNDVPQDRASVGVARGLVALGRGRPDDAFEAAASVARAAVDTTGMGSDGFRLSWPLALRAALGADRVDEAESLLRMVADAPLGHVPPYLRAELARYRGLVNATRGCHDTVEADLREAIAILTDLGYPYWLALTQIDLARWLIDQGRAADAKALVDEAVATFTRLGARPAFDAATDLVVDLGAAAPQPDPALQPR